MAEDRDAIRCEVCYLAADGAIFRRYLTLPAVSSIGEALRLSTVMELFPELAGASVGVFSRRRQLTDRVCDGDRIEVYRPLLADPKQARRRKVQHQREAIPDRWVRR